MKRRHFIATTGLGAVSPYVASTMVNLQANPQKQIIEHRIYNMNRGGAIRALEDYFADALIPALNKMGVTNVGAFTEYGSPEPAKVHLIIPYPSLEVFHRAPQMLMSDDTYQVAGQEFIKTPLESSVYTRYTSDVLVAFDRLPQLDASIQGERIFELRIYQGYNDDAVRRKVKMFNVEEIDLFYEVNLQPVFFGHAMAGINLPKLSYMLAFESLEQRDAAWQDFVVHPEWKRMSQLEEYADTVSTIEKVFLVPMDASQV